MNGVLVWADGRREPCSAEGGIYVIYVWPGGRGRCFESTFAIVDVVDGVWTYAENSVRDVTEDMARAHRENEERTWKYLRKGWGLDD